jgi:4-hydroxybenzoate polyprenyltransferase
VQFFLFTIPSVFYFLSPLRIALLSAICILGILYSINFKIGDSGFRLKNVFIVKNLFIGILWGSLILVGANGATNSIVNGLWIFTTLQVFIGSIIRDIPDVQSDKKDSVNSFPVVMGEKKTIVLLHVLNIISFGAGYALERKNEFILLMGITIVWRFISLVKVQSNPNSRLWSQTFNLLTCFLIFAVSSFELLYELY